MLNLLLFLFQVIGVSLSGVMAPGPVTAAAVAMGARSRYAGTFIAIGHAVVEFPLMLLIMLGMGKLLESTNTQIVIGLAGGALLLVMAVQMLTNLSIARNRPAKQTKSKPLLAGAILSASNPYFLLWWATVGLTLATTAGQLGFWAFALFAIVHWLCDWVWLQLLSWASFKGSKLLGGHSQRVVLLICSGALFFFGLLFIYNAANILIKRF